MSDSATPADLERLRPDAFQGEVHIHCDGTLRLDALSDLCSNNNYTWIQDQLEKLSIFCTNVVDVEDAGLLEHWQRLASHGRFPQLRQISVTYEAKRYKYIIKEANFELPTEEWFRVSKEEYAESFDRGEEDLEYEFPAEILQLQELRSLLDQNGKNNCEVILTTHIVWGQIRGTNPIAGSDEDGQRVMFRVLSDDLEAVERSY